MARCAVRRCRREETQIYYDWPICDYHWERHCDDDARFNLKKEFGIENVPLDGLKKDVDCVVMISPHDEFKKISLEKLGSMMAG